MGTLAPRHVVTIEEDSCTWLSVDAASCAARIIDELSCELRPDICGRGLLCLVNHCEGILRLVIANAPYSILRFADN